MRNILVIVLGVFVFSYVAFSAEEPIKQELKYAPVASTNPLRGLVPYVGDHGDRFPHSMEFNYLPLSAMVVGEDKYDWAALEKLLNEISGRGHQAIFRVYMEYPGKKNAIPEYLVKGGLKVHKYTNANTQPLPPEDVETPDYNDLNLRKCLKNYIAALGKKYDGDPRIGFITAGLLGTWGEWHTHPRPELWASKEAQAEVLDAYEAAFKITPILLRYPAGTVVWSSQAPNASRKFGYHDDSFAWATLDTGKQCDSWYFMAEMKNAGSDAVDKWKKFPMGGEIRPEAWGKVFDEKPDVSQIQDFEKCVKATHVSWLMDSGVFQDKTATEVRRKRGIELTAKMGYEFYVSSVAVTSTKGKLTVEVKVENRGVAPFYYDWPIEYALLSDKGVAIKTFSAKGKITGILPGDAPHIWKEEFETVNVPSGKYQLALRVPNPMPKGFPIRFANETQDQHAQGWLTLVTIAVGDNSSQTESQPVK